jgi:hypothetical protein
MPFVSSHRGYLFSVLAFGNVLRILLLRIHSSCIYLIPLWLISYESWLPVSVFSSRFLHGRIHVLRILLSRIPVFRTCSQWHFTYPALTDTIPLYISLPVFSRLFLLIHPAFSSERIHFLCILL